MKHLFYWLCLGQLILTLNNNVAAQDCPIPITIDTINACIGAPFTLTVDPQLPEGVTALYAWSGPAGTSVHQNPTIANMTPAKAGIYTITVTYSNNCIATASTIVFCNYRPTITAVAHNDTIIVSAHSNPIQNGVEYSLNSGAFQSDSVFVVCCNGVYTVTARDLITGCTETIWLTCVNCAPAFIADETVVSPFNIYPNPANNQITVSKLMNKDAKLLLYDITGKLIYQQVLQEKTTDISVQHLTIGVYYCKIDNTVFKLLITK